MGRVKIKKNHTKSLIIPGIFLTFLSKFSIVSILHFISRKKQVLKNNDQYQSKSSQVRENIEVYSLPVSCCLWRTSRCHMHLPMCWSLGQSSKTQETHQQDALPGHPADREHCPALDSVVVTTVQVSAHSKVSYLDGIVLTH